MRGLQHLAQGGGQAAGIGGRCRRVLGVVASFAEARDKRQDALQRVRPKRRWWKRIEESAADCHVRRGRGTAGWTTGEVARDDEIMRPAEHAKGVKQPHRLARMMPYRGL
jgi:hypothetical protein